MVKQRHAAVIGIIETADKINQGRFAAAGAADYTDGLTDFGRKRDIGQAGCACPLVGEVDMVELRRVGRIRNVQRRRARVLHRGMGV